MKSSESYFLLSIVSCHFQEGDVNSNHRELYFDIDITSRKRNGFDARSFFVCEDSHKKRYE